MIVSVLLGQGRHGLLHFLAVLSALAAAATSLGRVNNHTELLAQVCHLIWKTKAKQQKMSLVSFIMRFGCWMCF